MKQKLILLLIFIFSVCALWSQKEENMGRSAIKLFRKDNSAVKAYRIFDGDKYIGKLASDEYLMWTRSSGEMVVTLEGNISFPTIELLIEPNNMYEITLLEERYSTNMFRMQEEELKETLGDKSEYLIIYLAAGLLAIIALILVWKSFFVSFKIKKILTSGVESMENNEFEKAIINFTKAIKIQKKNPVIWQQLEKTYLKIGDFGNAELCKKKVIELLSGSNISEPFSDLTEINIDREELLKALNEKGMNLTNINIVRSLDSGYSGAKVILAELIFKENNSINFGVIKLDPGKSDNELFREAEGYKALSASWNSSIQQHIPQNSIFLKNSKTLSDKKEISLLLSSFADERNTKDVVTLREGLKIDFRKYLPCFTEMKLFYENQFEQISNNKFLPSIEHLKHILEYNFTKIKSFSWDEFGIQMDKRLINIEGKLYPNVIYFLSQEKSWNQEGFSCNYSTIHGDLNLDNVIIKSDLDFVLIDFEKTRETVFLFDLSFMITWIMQIFISEASQDKDKIIDFAEQIVSYIKNSDSTLGSPASLANFTKIIKELYPFKKRFGQNSQKAFLLSLLSAALLRSFYELRDYKRTRSLQNKRNGMFFYAFACLLSDNSDFIMPSKIITKDAFDLPEN